MAKLTDRSTLTTPVAADLVHVVDVSDTSGSAAGTSKKATLASVAAPFIAKKNVLVNAVSDFPAPVAGVITLAANTNYILGDNINIGTDRIVMGSNTAVSGIESIIVTLTYTGTGDMFTILNTQNRISVLSLSAVNGRVINFSDNTDSIFRMNDVGVVCATFGLFNSSGANGSTARFTNVSPSTITAGGVTTTGGWNTWLWETSAVNITGGKLFDFGTATFSDIVLDLILADLGAGTTLISGATASANINSGGIGSVSRMLTSGAGTILSGISVNDFRWEFNANDNIRDSMPDAMLSLNGNVTQTVINTTSVPVKVAGTWAVEREAHFTGSTSGRVTYIGERDIVVPVDISVVVVSASGNNQNVKALLALNGTVIANSGRSNEVGLLTPKSIPVLWQLTLSKDDFLEVFIQNDSSSNNLIVKDAILRVR